MKNKIIGFVLAICMLIPCALALSACGNESETGKITEEQWNSAFDYTNKTNIYIHNEVAYNGGFSDLINDVKYDGTTIHWAQWFKEEKEKSLVEYFYTKDGDQYLKIEKGAKGNESYTITKLEYDAVIKNEYDNLLGDLKFSDFEYDEETKSYKTSDNKHILTFTFSGDNLTKINYINKYDGSGSPMVTTTTITFDEIKINLPN